MLKKFSIKDLARIAKELGFDVDWYIAGVRRCGREVDGGMIEVDPDSAMYRHLIKTPYPIDAAYVASRDWQTDRCCS